MEKPLPVISIEWPRGLFPDYDTVDALVYLDGSEIMSLVSMPDEHSVYKRIFNYLGYELDD